MKSIARHADVSSTRGGFLLHSAAVAATLVCTAIGPFMQASAQALPAAKSAVKAGAPVTLNFVNSEIEAVARTIAVITGRQVVVDPRVKGVINLTTEQPVSPAAAYNQFLATLRLQGFTVVDVGGLDKVVPEADGKLQAGSVAVDANGGNTANGSQIVTQVFKLNFESANNLVPVLRPLISPNNLINVNPGNNSLVITDYADNLRRLGRIIAAMDVANATDLEIIPLKHAIASDLAPLVLRLVESSGTVATPGQSDNSYRTTVIAEPRSNSLIVRAANGARLALVKSLANKLDQPVQQGATGANGAAGNIYVVYLKNADATTLAGTLRAALSGEARSATPVAATTPGVVGTANAGAAAAAQNSTGGQIQADVATNSLIITAPEPQYRQIRAVIDRLDGRRAQVLVESLIVEVNADKAAQFGIQWQGALGNAGDINLGLLGTNFTTGNTPSIISLALSAASGTVSPAKGINLGVTHNTGGVNVLGALANFLQTNGDGNVLSMPNLMTLDNLEAKIVVGENVPFITGQFTNTGSTTGSVSPFQTIERKDVGLTLKVKPQINENGTVKLLTNMEVSAVKAGTEGATSGPTTNKRSVDSTVLVDDGTIVVLAGLMQDSYSGSKDQVPLLGNIPFFGNLFKSESRSRKKTNLMIFLRPVVVRDARDSDAISREKYDQMRGVQQGVQPAANVLLPVDEAPVLPTLAPPPAPRSPMPVFGPMTPR